ncbi:MAG: hypothetical protein K6C06_10655 [Lachnospiraceae bacterium]|nr:hypothetical protein [Lachnospiraceae bacterium]
MLSSKEKRAAQSGERKNKMMNRTELKIEEQEQVVGGLYTNSDPQAKPPFDIWEEIKNLWNKLID